jgi:hypothetical protein
MASTKGHEAMKKRIIYAAPPKTEGLDENQKTEVYRAVFDLVCDPHDWKTEIDATIVAPEWILPTEADQFRFQVIVAKAVEFMTATKARVTVQKEYDFVATRPQFLFRVRAIGYRAGPAGDH